MNDEVIIKWKCDYCETVNECTIGESNKQTQLCSKCDKPHYVNVKINVGKMTQFKFSR
jgi:hypothetical protein|nr:MAG TPA_asm: cysteine-rich protein [Caudoviricetes sp.]